MSIYRIAELNIAVEPRYAYTKEYLKDYLCDSDRYDLSVTVTDEMMRHEQELNVKIHGYEMEPALCEAVAILRVICDDIIRRKGFFLHCSCLRYRDRAIVFTAPSGTGKSTHASLWVKYLSDQVTMINDDKPLVREIDGRFIIYGTPWNGKHRIGNNISAPIGAIFYLEQAKENAVDRLDSFTALSLLLQQTVLPDTKESTSLLLDMLGSMLEQVPVYRLRCNISKEAVEIALSALKI